MRWSCSPPQPRSLSPRAPAPLRRRFAPQPRSLSLRAPAPLRRRFGTTSAPRASQPIRHPSLGCRVEAPLAWGCCRGRRASTANSAVWPAAEAPAAALLTPVEQSTTGVPAVPAQQVPPRRECRRASSQARIGDAASLPVWAQTLREGAQALFREFVVELTERAERRTTRRASSGRTKSRVQRLMSSR